MRDVFHPWLFFEQKSLPCSSMLHLHAYVYNADDTSCATLNYVNSVDRGGALATRLQSNSREFGPHGDAVIVQPANAATARGTGRPVSKPVVSLKAQLYKHIWTVHRHWKSLAALSGGVLVAALAAVFLWPATYRSSGTILIEQQEVPVELVRSATISYAEQRVQVISQRVMTSANLFEVIEKYDLYRKKGWAERWRKSLGLSASRESILEEMRDDIALNMISADVVDPRQGRSVKSTIAFSVSFDSRSPQLAAAVANELTTLFLGENVSMRKQQATSTADFLADEAQRIDDEVTETERKLAQFKTEHEGNIPELAQLNIQQASRAQDDLREFDSRIRSLDQQIVFLKAQLAQVNPTSSLYKDSSQRVLSTADQLRVLRSELAVARAKYSADHPDLLRLEREVSGLEAATGKTPAYRDTLRDLESRRADLAKRLENQTADHPDVVRAQREIAQIEQQLRTASAVSPATAAGEEPDNPAYIQVQASLIAAQADRSAVIVQRAQVATRLALLETRGQAAPNVERDYNKLVRDLDNARKRYAEVQQKQMEAQLSSNLESELKGERFTLIEPAVEPQKPVSPNRRILALLGLAFAVGVALGAVFLIEALDTRIHSQHDILHLLQVPPLAIIPWIDEDPAGKRVAHG